MTLLPAGAPASGLGEEVMSGLVRSLVVSPPALELFDGCDVLGVRLKVASHPATPPSVLLGLVSSGRKSLRARAALNPSLPVPVLERLAWSVDPWVGEQAVSNPSLPVEVLVRLAAGSPAQRSRAAACPRTPSFLLASLASAFPAHVAANEGAPEEVLVWLAGDPACALLVVRNAAASPRALTAAFPHLSSTGLAYLAEHPRIDRDLVLRLPACLVSSEVLSEVSGEVSEDVLSLVEGWEGSVSDLLEAVRLVRR